VNWCEGVRLVNNRTLGHSHFRGPAVDALVHFLTLERRRSIFFHGLLCECEHGEKCQVPLAACCRLCDVEPIRASL
jgi:hypothetical protein